MKINTIKRLLAHFFFVIFIAIGFAFTNSSVSPSNFEATTSTMFTDYFFPDPKKRDGKKQFVKKLCLGPDDPAIVKISTYGNCD